MERHAHLAENGDRVEQRLRGIDQQVAALLEHRLVDLAGAAEGEHGAADGRGRLPGIVRIGVGR